MNVRMAERKQFSILLWAIGLLPTRIIVDDCCYYTFVYLSSLEIKDCKKGLWHQYIICTTTI